MAGVFAFVAVRGDAAQRRGAVTDALRVLAHRSGEPAKVAVVPGGAALLGGAPLSYPSTGAYADRYVIVLDGEIFNAAELRQRLEREHGATFAAAPDPADPALDGVARDAEVVVAAYHHLGPSALNELRGPYAFVIWDTRARRAFGARDAWGVRPLYHLLSAEGLYLASEKKALLPFVPAEPNAPEPNAPEPNAPEVDLACVARYLTMQYVPEPATLHRRIGRIGAGESFAYIAGGPLANRRFASYRFRPVEPADPAVLYGQILAALRESVHAAVRAGTPTAGTPTARPVGAFLSGGLDSAAIVALAREVEPALPTFTVGYDVAGYTEIAQARATAAELGVPSTEVVVTAQDVMDALPRVVWHLDDPIGDPAVVALYLLAERASRDVGAVLSGEGADELFGGYGLYREPLSLAAVSGLPDPMLRGLRAVSRAIPQGVRGRSFLERGTTPVEERYSGNARVFTDAESASLLRLAGAQVHAADVTAGVYAEAGRLDDVTRMQFVDLYTRLRGDVLVKADRLTMAHALRLRTPFLDAAVFAVAATIPTDLRVPHRSHETKAALRRALTSVVPVAVVNRRRAAIRSPVGAWLRGNLGAWADDLVATSDAGDLLDLQQIRMLLAAHRAGEADHARKIWTVLNFCVWHAVFVAGTLTP